MRIALTLVLTCSIFGTSFSQWVPLNSGLRTDWNHNSQWGQAAVTDLEVFNGNLYACGDIDSAGGIRAESVVKWNGSAWEATGINPSGDSACYHSSWDLEVYNNELYACGVWGNCGFPLNDDHLARFDGQSWIPLDTANKVFGWSKFTVRDLQSWNGKLYILGPEMFGFGNTLSKGPISWNGTKFDTISFAHPLDSQFHGGLFLDTFQNNLLIHSGASIWEFDGQILQPIPLLWETGYQTSFISFNDMLLGGGYLNNQWGWDGQDTFLLQDPIYSGVHIPGPKYVIHNDILYTIQQNKVVLYDSLLHKFVLEDSLGTNWDALRCIEIYQDQLYVGGNFEYIKGQRMNSIMKWTGTLPSGSLSGFATKATNSKIEFFPNPIKDILTISIESKASEFLEASIHLTDLHGFVIGRWDLKAHGTQIDLNKLLPGVYMARIQVGSQVKIQKLVKE